MAISGIVVVAFIDVVGQPEDHVQVAESSNRRIPSVGTYVEAVRSFGCGGPEVGIQPPCDVPVAERDRPCVLNLEAGAERSEPIGERHEGFLWCLTCYRQHCNSFISDVKFRIVHG